MPPRDFKDDNKNKIIDNQTFRFELNSEECHRVISKMIINEELAASWDEPSSSLVLHKTDPSRIQNMTVQLAEKINQMVDMNEKILEWRAGMDFYLILFIIVNF